MSELTDLEVCKKIAEIEGYRFGTVFDMPVIVFNEDDTASFNPLTDDALCFQLMVKYEVSLTFNTGGNTVAECFYLDEDDGEVSCDGMDISPNRAICLAIIESQTLNKE